MIEGANINRSLLALGLLPVSWDGLWLFNEVRAFRLRHVVYRLRTWGRQLLV